MYLEQALGSETKVKILRTLYQESFPQLDAGAVSLETGKSRAGVHRALADLVGFGIVLKITRGRTGHYSVNVDHPWFGLFFELFREERRRSGVSHLFPTYWNHLEDVVSRLARSKDVLAVLLYGSIIRPPVYPHSDIDLLVVIAQGARPPALQARILGNQVSVLAMETKTFEAKAKKADAFLKSALERHVVLYRAPDYELPWVRHAPPRQKPLGEEF